MEQKKRKIIVVIAVIVILVIVGAFVYNFFVNDNKGNEGNSNNALGKDDPRKMNVTIEGTPIVNPDDIDINMGGIENG